MSWQPSNGSRDEDWQPVRVTAPVRSVERRTGSGRLSGGTRTHGTIVHAKYPRRSRRATPPACLRGRGVPPGCGTGRHRRGAFRIRPMVQGTTGSPVTPRRKHPGARLPPAPQSPGGPGAQHPGPVEPDQGRRIVCPPNPKARGRSKGDPGCSMGGPGARCQRLWICVVADAVPRSGSFCGWCRQRHEGHNTGCIDLLLHIIPAPRAPSPVPARAVHAMGKRRGRQLGPHLEAVDPPCQVGPQAVRRLGGRCLPPLGPRGEPYSS